MSEFKISCPRCQQHILCDDAHRGLQINCPTCNSLIQVPAGQASFASQPAAPKPAQSSRPSGRGYSRPEPASSSARRTQPTRGLQRGTPQRPRQDSSAWLNTWLLSFFLGGFGIDRFYNGRTGLGIGKLLTAGGCGYWAMIDFILLLAGKYQNGRGEYVRRPDGRYMTLQITGVVLACLFAAACLLSTLPVIGVIGLLSQADFSAAEIRMTASSPDDAWSGLRQAAQDKDYALCFEYLTPESQDVLISLSMLQIALKKAFAGPDAETTAEEQRITAVFERHGISLQPGASVENQLSQVADKGALFTELMEVQSSSGEDWFADGFPDGALTSVAITGDTANGKVEGETVAFRRIAGAWLVDLEAMMDVGMSGGFDETEMNWDEETSGRSSRNTRSRSSYASIEQLENDVLMNPNDASARYELAAKRAAYGDWASAIDELNRAFELSSEQTAGAPSATDLKAAVLEDDRFHWLLQQNPEFKETLSPGVE